MSRRPLIDSRLRNALPNHWPSRVTIQSVNFTSETSGQSDVPASGSDISGLEDLECRFAPINIGTPTDDEMRTDAVTEGKERGVLWINGPYSSLIVSSTMWAIVDGVKFTIRGVESDSQGFYTRLRIEAMSPNG